MGELVQVYATGDQVVAELTRSRLEDEGIDVLVKNSMGGSSAYPVGPSYLFVPEEQVESERGVARARDADRVGGRLRAGCRRQDVDASRRRAHVLALHRRRVRSTPL